jgi:FkbM family methyltransferase
MNFNKKIFKVLIKINPVWTIPVSYKGITFKDTFDVRQGDIGRIYVENYLRKFVGVNKVYEPVTLDFIRQYLPEKGVFIDVGANMGIFSRYARAYKKDATVIALEPNSTLHKKRYNVLRKDDIRFRNCAIGDKEEYVFLDINKNNLGHSKISYKGQRVLQITLDSIGIPFIDAIKIDVEGYEVQVLKGAKKLLKEGRIKAICIETMKETEDDVAKILLKNKYKRVSDKNSSVGNEIWVLNK